jgi:hypothetical protein
MDGTGSTLQDCYLMPGREYSPFLQSLLGSTSDCDVLHRGATCCTTVSRVAPHAQRSAGVRTHTPLTRPFKHERTHAQVRARVSVCVRVRVCVCVCARAGDYEIPDYGKPMKTFQMGLGVGAHSRVLPVPRHPAGLITDILIPPLRSRAATTPAASRQCL